MAQRRVAGLDPEFMMDEEGNLYENGLMIARQGSWDMDEENNLSVNGQGYGINARMDALRQQGYMSVPSIGGLQPEQMPWAQLDQQLGLNPINQDGQRWLSSEDRNKVNDWGYQQGILKDQGGFGDFAIEALKHVGPVMMGAPALLGGAGATSMFSEIMGNVLGNAGGALGDAATGVDSLADFNNLTPGNYTDLGGTLGGATTFPAWDPSILQSNIAPIDTGIPTDVSAANASGIENPANFGNVEELTNMGATSGTPTSFPPLDGAGDMVPTTYAAAGGTQTGSFWDTIGQSLGISGSSLKSGFGAAGSLLEWLQSQDNQRYLSNMIGDATNRADPFASQRPYYQNMLQQSYSDPDFFKNNAVFGGIKDVAVSDAQRAAAARGYNNSTNVLYDIADRVQKTGMNYANQFQGQLAQNAGAGIAPGNAAAIQAQGAQSVVNANQQSNGAFGNMLRDGMKFASSLV